MDELSPKALTAVKAAVNKRLVAAPINPEVANDLGYELFFHINKGNVKLCLEVIALGANLMVEADMTLDGYSGTSLAFACWKELPIVAVAIIECPDVDINLKEPVKGQTPLMMAIMKRLGPVVAALLRKGADINATDSEDKTALVLACETSYPEAALALINARANVHIGNLLEIPAVDTPPMKEVKDAIIHALGAPTGAHAKPPLRETAGGRRRKTRRRKHRKNRKHSHKKN